MMVDDDVFVFLDATRDINITTTSDGRSDGVINPCEGTRSQSITATLRNTKGGKLRAVKVTLDLRTAFWAEASDGFTGDATFTDTGRIEVVRTTG